MKIGHASFILLTVTAISVYYGLTIGDSLNRLVYLNNQSNDYDCVLRAWYAFIVISSFLIAFMIFIFSFPGFCEPGVSEQFFWKRDVSIFFIVTLFSATGAFFGSLAFGAFAAPISLTFFNGSIFIAVVGLTQTYMFFYRLVEARIRQN